jgi:small subunit ribosomal protein S15
MTLLNRSAVSRWFDGLLRGTASLAAKQGITAERHDLKPLKSVFLRTLKRENSEKREKETLMAVAKEKKAEILKKFQRADLDTGSSEVQIALLTSKINELTGHFATHKKDHHGRRGLVTAVNRRRKLLDYVRRNDVKKYESLLKALELRK